MEETTMEGVGVTVRVSGAVEPIRTVVSSPEDLVAALRRVGVFADLPEEQLRWFADNVEEVRLVPGDVLFRKGDPADTMAVYLEGEVHAFRNDLTDGYVYIGRAGDPATEVSGVLPFSRMKTWSATGRAITNMRVLRFQVRMFPELYQHMPELVQRLVGLMSDRVREVTAADQQH